MVAGAGIEARHEVVGQRFEAEHAGAIIGTLVHCPAAVSRGGVKFIVLPRRVIQPVGHVEGLETRAVGTRQADPEQNEHRRGGGCIDPDRAETRRPAHRHFNEAEAEIGGKGRCGHRRGQHCGSVSAVEVAHEGQHRIVPQIEAVAEETDHDEATPGQQAPGAAVGVAGQDDEDSAERGQQCRDARKRRRRAVTEDRGKDHRKAEPRQP